MLRTRNYFALGLLALDIADGVSGFLAGGVASGGFADGVADGGALGVITLPGTLGVALGVVGVGGQGQGREAEEHDEYLYLHRLIIYYNYCQSSFIYARYIRTPLLLFTAIILDPYIFAIMRLL